MGVLGVRNKKEKPIYSEELIQKILRYDNNVISPQTIKYCIENLHIFGWESDSLMITKSNYAYEFEIKISRADFKNDSKKKMKHLMLEGNYHLNGQEYVGDGKMRENDKPNYFYYVVPENLIIIDEIPIYAGLIYVYPVYNIDGTIKGYSTKLIKNAPKLHNEKIDEIHLKLIDKFYYNYISWKEKYESQIEPYKKLLKESKTINGKTYKYTLPEAMEQINKLSTELNNYKTNINIIQEEKLFLTQLNRTLRKLLSENNIECQSIIKKCEENFFGEESEF